LVFGYELGIISGALPQLQAQFYLGCVQQEAVVNALLIGSLSASVIGGWLIDSNLLILGGTIILIKRISFLALVVCRAIIGFAISISSMSCCIFVSEMVATERRGLMVTLYEVGITVGILLAYALNYVFSGVQGGWRYMFGLAIIPSLMQLVSIGFLPQTSGTSESLVTEDDSQQSDRSAGEMLNPHTTEQVKYSVFDLFKPKDNMCRRTAICLGLVLSQQFKGQPNVLFYASTILFSVGFQSNASAVLASVGLGIVIATLLAMVCSDKVGRRSLLIGGCTVLAIGLILTGVLCGQTVIDTTKQLVPYVYSTLKMKHHWQDHATQQLVYFQRKLGEEPSFINCFNVGANLIVSFSFLSITDVIGLSEIFFVYGVIRVAAAVFIFLVLPETKGRSLHKINRELSQTRYENIRAFRTLGTF
uniref:Solute carrier family 2 member 10 n=1 Tax=Cyprinus carpio carpio TaxID=630221 RepID=A0A9J8AXZ5_CYPCA